MAKQPPGPALSFACLFAGLLLIYYVLHSHGWSWGGSATFTQIWKGLPVFHRVIAFAGFFLSAYGLGGTLNAIAQRPSDR